MYSYDSSAPTRLVDAASARVTYISNGNATIAIVQPVSDAKPQFAFVGFPMPLADISQGSYSIRYDTDSLRRRPALHSEATQRKDSVPADSTDIRNGITFKDAAQAHDLFLRIRCLANCTEPESSGTLGRLVNVLLLHPVTIAALSEALTNILKQRKLNDGVRDDLSQETVVILISRLASPGLHFHDFGVRPFLAWFDAYVEGVCSDASWTKRIVGPRKVKVRRLETLPDRPAPSKHDQEQVDHRDSAEFMAAVIEGIPDSDTRETVRGVLSKVSLAEIGRRLGTSAKRVAGFRNDGFIYIRRNWPRTDAGPVI